MKTKTTTWFKKTKATGVGLLFQASAQFVPLAPIDAQSGSKLSGIYTGGDLSTYISKMFVFAISIGAIIAVVRLMWAGYLYMGSDLVGNKSKAITTLREVVIGLLLLLSIWLVLQKINPQLLTITVLDSIKNAPSSDQQAPVGKQGPQTCPGSCNGPGSWCDTSTGVCIIPPN